MTTAATKVPQLDGYVTTVEAAEILGTSKQNVHSMILSDPPKFLTARRVGGDSARTIYVIGRAEVEGLAAQKRAKAAALLEAHVPVS